MKFPSKSFGYQGGLDQNYIKYQTDNFYFQLGISVALKLRFLQTETFPYHVFLYITIEGKIYKKSEKQDRLILTR